MMKTLPPQTLARLAGVLYLIVIAGGLTAEAFIREKLIAGGNPELTTQNILANEGLFRLGTAVNSSFLLCNIPFAVLFYEIFKPAGRRLALLVALMLVLVTSIEVSNLFHLTAATDILTTNSLSSFTAPQIAELAYVQIDGFAMGFGTSFAFFGFTCWLYAVAIWRSGFVPKFIGGLIALAGACYIVYSYSLILSPDLSATLFPLILMPCLIGELIFALWLAIKGINTARWHELSQTQSSS